jgi:hypothetical protein
MGVNLSALMAQIAVIVLLLAVAVALIVGLVFAIIALSRRA